MMNMRQQVERFGATIIDDEVTRVDFKAHPFLISTNSETYEALSVLACTGASSRKLGIQGDRSLVVEEYHIAQLAMAHFLKVRILQIVGGGDSALEEATFLTNLGDR